MDALILQYSPDRVPDFWFPDDGFCASREAFSGRINHRMQGGVDDHICEHFAGLTESAARGLLDNYLGVEPKPCRRSSAAMRAREVASRVGKAAK